jgi:ElaB/YqjD/DUF883 family membrane-anchored ribosome-binding protein
MSHQDFERAATSTSRDGGGKAQKVKDTANQAYAKASDVAREAGAKAKQAASDTASTMTEQVKDLIDRQIGSGADMATQFASSVRLAADDLDNQSPMLAGLVRNFANRIETYAEDMQDQTIDHFARAAADFTRKQPAVVFGLAAVAGFLVFRTVKSAQRTASPPIQPMQEHADQAYG